MARELIRKWLKAGIFEQGIVLDSTGTPQGSIISPLLCNIALHGLEREIGVQRNSQNYVIGPRSLIRYADDFVILCTSYEEAKKAMVDIQNAIKKRDLELAPNKTRIVNLIDGFNFLGYFIQLIADDGVNPKKNFIQKGLLDNTTNDYQIVDNSKALLLIKPSEKSVNNLKKKIKEVFKEKRQTRASNLIKILNPILRGWALSKNCWHSNRTFHNLDNYVFNLCWRWIHRFFYTPIKIIIGKNNDTIKNCKNMELTTIGSLLIQLLVFSYIS
jgi:RNA-directed DNA polymerase